MLTAQEDGAGRLPDPDLLDRATALRRVLFSQDSDLLEEATRRQRTGQPFAGLVYAYPLRATIGRCVRDLEIRYDLDDFLKPHRVWLDSGVDDVQRGRALGERLWQKRQQELASEAGTSAFLSPRGSVSSKRDVRPVKEGLDSPAQR